MQPDPEIFLWRVGKDLRDLVTSGAVTNPGAALVIDRAAEMLSQLSVREGGLAKLLNEAEPEQRALITGLAALAADIGAADIGAPAPSPSAPNGAGVSAAYDGRAKAIELALGSTADVALDGPEAPRWRALAAQASELESRVRREAAALVNANSAAETQRTAEEEARPEPPSPGVLEAYLAAHVTRASKPRVTAITQQRGVNTKDILFLELADVPGWPQRAVMRRLRGYNVNFEVSMSYEHQLLNALRDAGVKAPRSLLLEPGDALGHPFVILEQIPGEARKAAQLGVHGRPIAEQVAFHLASIHQVDPAITGRPELALAPRPRIVAQFEKAQELWRANHVEPSAMMEAAFAWAKRAALRLSEQTVLVHGDFDLRNILVDGDQVTAVLDWERSHVGHPAEDLAYCRPDIEQLMPWPEFLALYEAHGGCRVSEWELSFFKIWGEIHRLVSIGRAHSGYARRDHADILIASAAYIEQPRMSEVLHAHLLKVMAEEPA